MFRRPTSAIPFLICFIFTVIYTTTVTNSTSASPLQKNETDHQALLAIKDLLMVEDPLSVLNSWNHSIHFCLWQGVTCGRKHQRVTILNLSSLRLTGSLSPNIGNLSFIRKIDLSNNSFHGTIPQEIGKLFRLRYFRLTNNSFEGELPANLTHCSNIQVMYLLGNNLTGEIPAWLGSLSSLIRLEFSGNHFVGSIPASFGNLSALTVLSLANNNLGGSIPFELGRFLNLQFLQLTNNKLSGRFPTSLFNISSIYYFSIGLNLLHGSLPPNLWLTLPKIQHFYIPFNHFYGPIPLSLTNASGLEYIDINSNSFIGPIPMNLGKLQALILFDVSNNSIGTDRENELEGILTSLSNCSNLQELWLGENHFRGRLPLSIANMSNLIYLHLHANYISGSIPPGMGNLENLLSLQLNENMLTGRIPDSIGKLSKLVELHLYINGISGEIPSSIGNLTQLTILNLRVNMLEGSIPVSLGNCMSLLGIHLGYNRPTGPIPEQIFGLSSLSIGLYLGYNQLTGPVPMQVSKLKNLGNLDLSENRLSGEIPTTLGSFPVLVSLSMAGNHFQGIIKPSFEQLKGIQVLDLSRNNLSGQIPTFFEEFTSIQMLNLSYNMFEGEVRQVGLFNNTSAFSIVGNNKLCGGVKALQLPACPAKIIEKRKRRFHGRVIIPIVTSSAIVALLLCILAAIFQIRKSRQQTSAASTLPNNHPKLSYAEILQATNGFSPANLIGQGRYGSVYKGILNSIEQTVAVKVLNLYERGADRSFIAECEALKNIRHRNLVKIITSCSSIDFKGNDFKALVYEFMSNGSLESWLHPSLSEQQDPKSLNVVQRLNIAIDVASALDYLHHHCEMALIHCDLKPSNILLDDDLCAHVGDFGLAKILSATTGMSSHQQSSSIGIRGTIGYVAPEYGMGGEVSAQGDMYSYGVLLLEMFTGKRPTDNRLTDNISLHDYATMSIPDQIVQIIDPRIMSEEEEKHNRTTDISTQLEACLASVLQIGVSCSAEVPSERLTAKDVLVELNKIRKVLLGVRRQGLRMGE